MTTTNQPADLDPSGLPDRVFRVVALAVNPDDADENAVNPTFRTAVAVAYGLGRDTQVAEVERLRADNQADIDRLLAGTGHEIDPDNPVTLRVAVDAATRAYAEMQQIAAGRRHDQALADLHGGVTSDGRPAHTA